MTMLDGDTDRRIVRAVMFGDGDLYVLGRALRGHVGALGPDEKDRDRVGRHLHRLENQGEPYFEADLRELQAVLGDLIALWGPQTTVEWWREQGAPGSVDAVAGLALERMGQVERANEAERLVGEAPRRDR